jgi:hypothetical protein
MRREPQRVAQFHYLDTASERRVRPRGDKGNEAGTKTARCEQRPQAWLHFDDNIRGDPRERWQEARELDCIAEPVIATHEHFATGKAAAVPNPALMTGQSGVVTRRRIARREHLIADGPSRFMVAAAHGRQPKRCGIGGVSLWHYSPDLHRRKRDGAAKFLAIFWRFAASRHATSGRASFW